MSSGSVPEQDEAGYLPHAAEAGFNEVEILPIETDYWRFYRLMP